MNRDLVMPIASSKLLYDFNNNDNLTTQTINMSNSTTANNSNCNKNNSSNNNNSHSVPNNNNNNNNTSSFIVTNEFNQYYTTSSTTSTPIQIATSSNNSNNQAIANNNNNSHSHTSASSKYTPSNSNYLLEFNNNNNNNNVNDINECSSPPSQASSSSHTQHQQHSYYKNTLLNQQFYTKNNSMMSSNQLNHATTYPAFNSNWSANYGNENELNNGFYQNLDVSHSMPFSTHIQPNGLIQTPAALLQTGTINEENHLHKTYISNFNDSNNNVDLTNLNVDLTSSLNPITHLSNEYSNEIKNPTYFSLNPAVTNYDYLINTKQKQLLSSIFKEIDIKKNQIRLADSEKTVKEHLIELTTNIANCFVNNLCLDKNNNNSSNLTSNLNSFTNLSKSSELEHITRPLLIAYAYLVDHDNMNDSLNRYIKKSVLFLLLSHQLTPYELKLIHLINKIYQTNESNTASFVEMKSNRSAGSSSCSSSVSSSSSISSSSSSSSCMRNHRNSKRFKSECDHPDDLTHVSPSIYYSTKPKIEPFQPASTTPQTCYEYYPNTYNENADVKVETNYYFNDSGFAFSNGFDQTNQYTMYHQQQQPATYPSTCQSIHSQNSGFSNGNSTDSSLNQLTTVSQDVVTSKPAELKLLHFLLLLFSSYLEIDQFVNGTEMPNENSINLNKYFNSMNASFYQKLIIKLIDRVCKDKLIKTKILLTVSELELI
jgi:hypothetical protein